MLFAMFLRQIADNHHQQKADGRNRNISSEIISLYCIDCFAANMPTIAKPMPAMALLVAIKVLSDSLLRVLGVLCDDGITPQPESHGLQRS